MRSPLRFDSNCLSSIASRMLDNLACGHDSVLKLTLAFLVSSPIIWGSACSGSECPHWCFAAIVCAVSSRSAHHSVSFDHEFSAELQAEKRRWIQSHFSGRYLFPDIMDLSRARATCDLRGVVDMSLLRRLDIFLSGFSCKDVSRINTSGKHDGKDPLDSTSGGQTSTTFLGVLLMLQHRRPKALIVENVPGLLDKDAHLQVYLSISACQ